MKFASGGFPGRLPGGIPARPRGYERSPKAKALRDKILGDSADETLSAQSLFLSNAKKKS
jgi:hypothetical protein